jgi:hypothetical protein
MTVCIRYWLKSIRRRVFDYIRSSWMDKISKMSIKSILHDVDAIGINCQTCLATGKSWWPACAGGSSKLFLKWIVYPQTKLYMRYKRKQAWYIQFVLYKSNICEPLPTKQKWQDISTAYGSEITVPIPNSWDRKNKETFVLPWSLGNTARHPSTSAPSV